MNAYEDLYFIVVNKSSVVGGHIKNYSNKVNLKTVVVSKTINDKSSIENVANQLVNGSTLKIHSFISSASSNRNIESLEIEYQCKENTDCSIEAIQ